MGGSLQTDLFQGCTTKSGFLILVAISICLHCKILFPSQYVVDFTPESRGKCNIVSRHSETEGETDIFKSGGDPVYYIYATVLFVSSESNESCVSSLWGGATSIANLFCQKILF